MRVELLELAACPACHQSLTLEPIEADGEEIITGQLLCKNCGRRYSIERRMPLLYVDDAQWSSKAREAQGWVDYHKALGIYQVGASAVDLKVPYYPEEPWIGVARHFDAALALMQLTGREVMLDLGAGRGWAAKQFALKGCRAVAIDITTDEQVGLGRAYALMADAGIRFETAIGDSENLPFFDGAFDIVFCAAALHHTSNLAQLLKSAHKVLKRGGQLIAINEPCSGLHENHAAMLKRYAAQELSFGINESRPTYLDYLRGLTGAGFQQISINPIESFGLDDAALEKWAMQIGAVWPKLNRLRLMQLPLAVMKYFNWRLRPSSSRSGAAPKPDTRREVLIQSILMNKGASVIIVANKQASV